MNVTTFVLSLHQFFEIKTAPRYRNGTLLMMQQMIARLKEIAKENPNGFTVHLPTMEPVTKGWIVAKLETQNSFGDDGLKRALEVAIKTSKIVGGWHEDGKWYWDASDVYQDESEATKAGIANEQIAIYNIETANLKFL